MAYFSNGSEGEVFDNECAECLLGQMPCPIFMTQMQYNYEACNDKLGRKILNCLVKQGKNFEYHGCQMKPLIDKLKARIEKLSGDIEGQLRMEFTNGKFRQS